MAKLRSRLPQTPARSELAAALGVLPRRLRRHRPDQRHEQHPDADRLVLHARSLRPRAAEPQRADADRARILAGILFTAQGLLDLIRGRLLVRIGIGSTRR